MSTKINVNSSSRLFLIKAVSLPLVAAAKVEITPEALQIVLDEWRKQFAEARQTNDVRLMRTWIYRFVSKIEIGYNHAKIHYTCPTIEYSLSGSTSRNTSAFLGVTEESP